MFQLDSIFEGAWRRHRCGNTLGFSVRKIFAWVLSELWKLIQDLIIVRVIFEIDVSRRMESCRTFDGTSGDAQACSCFQFIKEARSAFSSESSSGFFGRIKPAEGFLVLPLDLFFYSRSKYCKMPVGFQALAAVTVNHWTQLSSDLETDPAAKAARVMDFHASSLVLDFLLNRQTPIPLLVSRKGYCYKMGDWPILWADNPWQAISFIILLHSLL